MSLFILIKEKKQYFFLIISDQACAVHNIWPVGCMWGPDKSFACTPRELLQMKKMLQQPDFRYTIFFVNFGDGNWRQAEA